MSKKNRLLERERAKQIVAQQKRAAERRKRLAVAGGAVAVVVVALAVLVIVKVSGGKSNTPAAKPGTLASAQLVSDLTGVPPATLDKVGTGGGSVNNTPKAITGQPVLNDGGKPLIVYMGAEYCPYCAAERWAMVVALSRFGTFHKLGQTHSSSTDVFPNTPTLSFHGATYTSQYLSFQGVEMQSNQPAGNNSYKPLDTPTAQQNQLMQKYNAPPYVSSDSAGSIPFIDFANQGIVSGASYTPQVLAGKTADEIGAALKDPNSAIAKAIDGTANAFTTMLCQVAKDQPADVCNSAAAKAFQGKLNGQS